MGSGLEQLRDRERRRYRALRALYELAGGETWVPRGQKEIARATGLPAGQVEDALDYLIAEGLAHLDGAGIYSITHKGVVEIELSIRRPALATEHFAPQVTQHFHGAVASSVVGSAGAVTVTQGLGAGGNELLALVERARADAEELPRGAREEVEEQLDNLAEELSAERPRPSRVRAFWGNVWKHKEEGVKFAASVLELYAKLNSQFPGLPG